MGRTDLIAVDGSAHSQHAFDWYLQNMHREGDEVVVVHCAEFHVDVGLPGRAADVDAICAAVKKQNDEIGNLTDGYMNILRQKKIKAQLLVPTNGKPGELIVKEAKEKNVSTIVLGTRGLGTIRRTLLGSVSEYVVHHSHCPVTVVREEKDAQDS
ncbi:USP-like protein isoform 2 [Elysia marginata]|uniref:USP-like protein isoform 2 n=1 Tax=Elysia marginata TaxID=1093978 RepID=A0AAV4JZ52_9GAST|nr:USP-like protein isoform 2 [Elysia marginata]